MESSSKCMNRTCVRKCPNMYGSGEKIALLSVKIYCSGIFCTPENPKKFHAIFSPLPYILGHFGTQGLSILFDGLSHGPKKSWYKLT